MQSTGQAEAPAGQGSDRAAPQAITILALPPELIARIAAFLAPGPELLRVCKALRDVCLASVTGAKLKRGYDGAVDDVHVATLARCPRLTRLEASQLDVEPWPLAAVTRLTALTVCAHWREVHIPTSVRQLRVSGPLHDWEDDGDGAFDEYEDDPDTASYLYSARQLLCGLRDRSCNIRFDTASVLMPLSEPWMAQRVRVHELDLEGSALGWSLFAQLATSVLSELTRLRFMGCATVPQSVVSLRRLQRLEIASCDDLDAFDVFPSAITALDIQGSANLTRVELTPTSTPHLLDLYVVDCSQLRIAHAAATQATLQKLRADCFSPEEVYALRACVALTHLELICHDFVPSSHDMLPLRALRSLNLRSVSQEFDFVHLGALPVQLTSLDVWNCPRLASLAGLSHVTALEFFSLQWCDGLRTLAGLPGNMPQLTYLSIHGCNGLESLVDMPNMPALEGLYLEECASLREVHPGLPALPRVDFLRLTNESELPRLQLRATADGLQCLVLEDLDWTNLRILGRLPQLRNLELCTMSRLLDLEGLGEAATPKLANLQLLKSPWTSLRGIGTATSLTKIYVRDCYKLSTLEGLEGATQLQSVHLERYAALESLQGLASCVREQDGALLVEVCHGLKI